MGGGDDSPPPPPDFADSYRKGINVDIETLPRRARVLYNLLSSQGDFQGIGAKEFGKLTRDEQLQAAKEMAGSLLDLQKQYGADFVAEARKQLQASDPEAFQARQGLGQQINGASIFEDIASSDVPALSSFSGSLPTFESLSAPANAATDGGGNSDAIRQALESQILADVNSGGNLSDGMRREIEQSVMRGQAAETF